MKLKIYNILTIILLLLMFVFASINTKLILLSLGSKVVIIIGLLLMTFKLFKNKNYILCLLNITFIGLILSLSSNIFKPNMMSNIEMYYIDAHSPINEIINDNDFSAKASEQKFYAKYAQKNLIVSEKYITAGKKLKYSMNYYYQLCLFFTNNLCVYKMDTNRKLSKEDYLHELSDYQYNKIKWYYRDVKFASNKKEGILLRDFRFKKIDKNEKLDCVFLLYGSQNGWKDYHKELLTRIKNDNKCYAELNQHFVFAEEIDQKENKSNFIKFLESNISVKKPFSKGFNF